MVDTNDQMDLTEEKPWGYKWRSSTPFVMVCITISQFTGEFSDTEGKTNEVKIENVQKIERKE